MGNRKESNIDPLEDLEEDYTSNQESQGYSAGLELGKRDGKIEGYTLGFNEGCRRGAELGYFNGYTMTRKQLLSEYNKLTEKQDQLSKTIKKYNDILELIGDFPRTNEINCEEKLSTISAKFKQAFPTITNPATTILTSQNKEAF